MKPLLVDVREPEEFMAGSVKNAVSIPLDQVEIRLSEFKNQHRIIVFCRSGIRAEKARQILSEGGIKNIENGGAWQKVGQQFN